MTLVLVVHRRLLDGLERGHVRSHDGHLRETKVRRSAGAVNHKWPAFLHHWHIFRTAHLFICTVRRYHGDRVSSLRCQFVSWDGYGGAFLGYHGDRAPHCLQVCLRDTDLREKRCVRCQRKSQRRRLEQTHAALTLLHTILKHSGDGCTTHTVGLLVH